MLRGTRKFTPRLRSARASAAPPVIRTPARPEYFILTMNWQVKAMINRVDLLDPVALDDRSEYEKNVVEGAQNAGHGPRCIGQESVNRHYGGALHQVINPRAIMAAECG